MIATGVSTRARLGTYARLFNESGNIDEHKRIGDAIAHALAGQRHECRAQHSVAGIVQSGYARMVGESDRIWIPPIFRYVDPAVRALVSEGSCGRADRVSKPRIGSRGAPSALEGAERLGPSAALGSWADGRTLSDDNANARMRALPALIAWRDQIPGAKDRFEQVHPSILRAPIRRAARSALAPKG